MVVNNDVELLSYLLLMSIADQGIVNGGLAACEARYPPRGLRGVLTWKFCVQFPAIWDQNLC